MEKDPFLDRCLVNPIGATREGSILFGSGLEPAFLRFLLTTLAVVVANGPLIPRKAEVMMIESKMMLLFASRWHLKQSSLTMLGRLVLFGVLHQLNVSSKKEDKMGTVWSQAAQKRWARRWVGNGRYEGPDQHTRAV